MAVVAVEVEVSFSTGIGFEVEGTEIETGVISEVDIAGEREKKEVYSNQTKTKQ